MRGFYTQRRRDGGVVSANEERGRRKYRTLTVTNASVSVAQERELWLKFTIAMPIDPCGRNQEHSIEYEIIEN